MKSLMIRITKADNGELDIDAAGQMGIGDTLIAIEIYKKTLIERMQRGNAGAVGFDERIREALNVK